MALIDSPDDTGVVNAYVIFIATESRAYNRFWQSVDPDVRVAYVKRFAIDFTPISLLESSFHAVAPKPTPSPFTAEGIVGSNRLVMAERFWARRSPLNHPARALASTLMSREWPRVGRPQC